MEEYSYTSTHPLGHTGPVTGSLYLYSKLSPLQSLKKYTREAVTHSQRLSITLRYLVTGNNFEDLKFVRVTSRSIGSIVLRRFLLIGRQTVTECILSSTIHR